MANTPPILPVLPTIAAGPTAIGSQQSPPALPQLPAGTVINGSVAGQDAKGNIVVQNDTVQLILSTRYPLNKGAQVTVRIDPPVTREAPTPIRILTIDGRAPGLHLPPATTSAPTSSPAQSGPASSGGVLPQQEMPKPVGILMDTLSRGAATLRQPLSADAPVPQAQVRGVAAEVVLTEAMKSTAVLLRPALSANAVALLSQLATQTATPLPSPAAALRPGLQMQVRFTIPAQPAAPSMPAAPQAQNPATLAPDLPPLPVSSQLRSGYALYARQSPATMPGATGALPPQQTNPAPPALPVSAAPHLPANSLSPQAVEQLLLRAEAHPLPKGQMPAIVVGKEQGGALIVQTRLGMFTLPQTQANALQPGNVLTWQVTGLQTPPPGGGLPPLAGMSGALAGALPYTSHWQSLTELSALLHGMQSSMAAQTLQRVVPHIGAQFSSGLLFFISVLRKGDVSDWLGRDMTRQLERMGKGDLVQRLGQDIGALRALFNEQPQGNWQALFFPVMVEKQLHQAQMFVKRDEPDKKQGGGGTRFVVELELSNLGPMQMDGLVRKREGKTQFDLVVRTLFELPDALKTDIYAIFDNAQKATGLHGSLNFRQVPEFPVNPMQDLQKGGAPGLDGIIA